MMKVAAAFQQRCGDVKTGRSSTGNGVSSITSHTLEAGPKGPAFFSCADTVTCLPEGDSGGRRDLKSGLFLSPTAGAGCLCCGIVVTPHIHKTPENSLDKFNIGRVHCVTLGDVKDYDNR